MNFVCVKRSVSMRVTITNNTGQKISRDNIGFPRVFQTFFIHFHSKNNSISSRKMSLNKSRFQFQTCFKQFQNCVIMFQTFFIDFRRFGCLIRPILRRVVIRRSKFVLCHSYSNFFHSYSSGVNGIDSGFYALNIHLNMILENLFVRWHGKTRLNCT